MGINLGLELLQLRPLGENLLLVHLVDERVQLFHHGVEPGVNILEFVVLPMADDDAEVAVFDFAEGLGQLDQGLVNVFIDIERINHNHHQSDPRQGDKPSAELGQRLEHRILRHILAQHRPEKIRGGGHRQIRGPVDVYGLGGGFALRFAQELHQLPVKALVPARAESELGTGKDQPLILGIPHGLQRVLQLVQRQLHRNQKQRLPFAA
ncbi:hypothetical protein D3C76_1194200 [compost metagenome]